MVRITLRISKELHEKLRWHAYKERRSQQTILVEMLERALADIEVPEEGRTDC